MRTISPDHGPATVSDIGETGLIKRIAARLPSPPHGEVWTGDDAAVVLPPPRRLLLTTDVMVEGQDFDFGYCHGEDVGWKAVAANASDIAAMGGRPLHAVASLALPVDVPVTVVDAIVDGMSAAAAQWGIDLVGGDISAAGEMSVSLTVTGATVGDEPVGRSGAVAGQAICLTGHVGGAWGGLHALQRSLQVSGPDMQAIERLVRRQLRPSARVEEAAGLVSAGATSMIDVSDGLAVDLGHLMDASGTGCSVALDAIPVDPDLGVVTDLAREAPYDALEAAILGGEDFELLCTLDTERVAEAQDGLLPLGTKLTRLGTVTEGECRLGDTALEEWRARGWDHLRGR